MNWINHHSIKTKLLVGFSAIFLLMFVLLFLLNQLFLDDYFLYVNHRQMVEVTNQYSEAETSIDYKRLLGHVSKESGGQVSVYHPDGTPYIGEGPMDNRPPTSEGQMEEIYKKARTEEGYFQVLGEGESTERQIVYTRMLIDGNYIKISKGLGVIGEARRLFVLFLLITSLVVYLIGFIGIYFYAARFTGPIIRLKSAAERMAAMDFTEQVAVGSEDEVGQLVKSLNGMARALSVSINDLNVSKGLLEKELTKERSLENMRRRFVTDVSHELKNPISMIIGYADGIQRGVPNNKEERQYYAQVIKEEGQRMNRLVTDLLDISSYASGTLTMKMTEVDVGELIRSVLGRYRRTAEDKHLLVRSEGDYTALVHGDSLRLEQVFVNLLDNAFKHVDKTGEIFTSVETMGQTTKISIGNTGDLIPVDELENIWESFYQVDTDAEGNGLGLTIVKSIVESHGGDIRVYVDGTMNIFELTLKS